MPSMFKNIKKKIKKIIKGDETNRRIKWSLYARVWREIGRPQLIRLLYKKVWLIYTFLVCRLSLRLALRAYLVMQNLC